MHLTEVCRAQYHPTCANSAHEKIGRGGYARETVAMAGEFGHHWDSVNFRNHPPKKKVSYFQVVAYLFKVAEHDFCFPYIGNFIIQTDELIFFRGVAQPPTSFCNSARLVIGNCLEPPLGETYTLW